MKNTCKPRKAQFESTVGSKFKSYLPDKKQSVTCNDCLSDIGGLSSALYRAHNPAAYSLVHFRMIQTTYFLEIEIYCLQATENLFLCRNVQKNILLTNDLPLFLIGVQRIFFF